MESTTSKQAVNASPRVVSHDEWIIARKALLEKEKELCLLQDQVNAARKELPFELVDDYTLEGPKGPQKLSTLFGDSHDTLVVYHLMMSPTDERACKNCSYIVDDLDGVREHLLTHCQFVCVAQAPYQHIARFAASKKWRSPMFSVGQSQFGFDMGVQFTPEQVASKELIYN